MSVFDSLNDTSSHAVDAGERLLKTSYEYYKLRIFKQVSVSISMVFKTMLIGGFALIGITFLAVSLAFFIGTLLNDKVLGFVIVGGLFVLLAVLLFFMRGMINRRVVKKLSKTFFK